MSAYLVNSSFVRPDAVESLKSNPEFRRATLNMMLAVTAAKRVLLSIPEVPREKIGLVVGTSLGELQASLDFLTGVAVGNTARPLPFQNSLYHSTLGTVSRMFKLTGPGLTVSDQYFSGEQAIDVGFHYLRSGCQYALVMGVDCIATPLQNAAQARTGENFRVTSGAGAILLAREPLAAGDPLLKQIIFPLQGKDNESPMPYYDSNAVEKIACLTTREAILRLVKPNGSYSEIQLEWE